MSELMVVEGLSLCLQAEAFEAATEERRLLYG
jgi:hypothetical protein